MLKPKKKPVKSEKIAPKKAVKKTAVKKTAKKKVPVPPRKTKTEKAEPKLEKEKTTEEQIAKIKKIYNDWQTGENYIDIPELCKSATIKDIEKQNYSLAPSKYIEFIDHDLDIDYEKEMKRIQVEMKLLLEEEKKSQAMLEKAFEGIGFPVTGKR